MTSHCKLQTTTERYTVNRGNARLVHTLDLAEGEVRIIGERHCLFDRVDLFEQLANISAGHEALGTLAGKHNRRNIIPPAQVINNRIQFIECALIQCINRRICHRHHRQFAGTYGRWMVLNAEVAVALDNLLFFGQTLLALPLSDLSCNLFKHLRVTQRRRITEWLIEHHIAQEAAHILTAARLGKRTDLDIIFGHTHRTLLGAHQLIESSAISSRQPSPRCGLDESNRRQTLFTMGSTDNDTIPNRRIGRNLAIT